MTFTHSKVLGWSTWTMLSQFFCLMVVMRSTLFVVAFSESSCRPEFRISQTQCKALAKYCSDHFHAKMKWVPGCDAKLRLTPRVGSCQCDNYCAISCKASCEVDPQCVYTYDYGCVPKTPRIGFGAAKTCLKNDHGPFRLNSSILTPITGSISVNVDGTVLLIGGDGIALVFSRSSPSTQDWQQQGGGLIGTGSIGVPSGQGAAVALSKDGQVAFIGDPSDNDDTGAAWAFTKNGSNWVQQGKKLIGNSTLGNSDNRRFGGCLALSGNGMTALIGRTYVNDGAGTAWVFVRGPDGLWTQQGPNLVVGNFGFGDSVALSDDGNVALIGGVDVYDDFTGAAWIFLRQGTIWMLANKLTAATSRSFLCLGSAVALSANGNTAVAGAHCDNVFKGSAWIFNRNSSSSWEGQMIVGTNEKSVGGFATNVAMNDDGNMTVFSDSHGAIWIFLRHDQGNNNVTWTQFPIKLTGRDVHTYGQHGSPTFALSGDGKTLFRVGFHEVLVYSRSSQITQA